MALPYDCPVLGKKDETRIRQIFAIGLQVSLGVAILFCAIGVLTPHTVMRLFTSRFELFPDGIAYLRVIAWSLIFYAMTDTLIAMLRSVEVVRISLVISVVSLCCNFVGNWLLIFGNLGFPALGVRGAAFSTLFARIVELACVLFYVLRIDRRLRLRLRDFLGGSREMFIDFIRWH